MTPEINQSPKAAVAIQALLDKIPERLLIARGKAQRVAEEIYGLECEQKALVNVLTSLKDKQYV